MEFPPLLAKSKLKSQSQSKTLVEHTQDVLDAVAALFGTRENLTRLGQQWIKFFQLTDIDLFMRSLTAAAALHDLGKANHDFQQAVSGKSDGQLIRHEHLSGILMQIPAMRNWLELQTQVDWDVVLSAVVCHHLKASDETLNCSGKEAKTLMVFSDHENFVDLLNLMKHTTALPEAEFILPTQWSVKESPPPGYESLSRSLKNVCRSLTRFERKCRHDLDRERLLRAVRSALIVADAAGSGLPRENLSVSEWITKTFSAETICDSEYIHQHIIHPRTEQLASANGPFQWSSFQQNTADLPPRALLLAPCGSGKTLAAWRWIENHATSGVRHCLFLYPTRATATEGFRDYVSWAPETDAALFHGTAAYELDGLFSTPEEGDTRSEKNYETEQRLYAIGYWRKRIFSATVDQFFSFLQYSYSGMCLLPVLADSVVVVDEVHSFDQSMFQSLKDFLTEFPSVPVLCMTATLPRQRQEELKDCQLTVLDAYQEDFDDLKKVAEAPRYRVQSINEEDADQIASEALKQNKKVLWVVNTVARAQEIARRFAVDQTAPKLMTADDYPLYCYHSRYRLCDREERHQEVVKAFRRDESRAVLAVTTQVCEMGLDLDADVLITEAAPVTSLIQRMGRCNRAKEPRSKAGAIYLYRPEKLAPYDPEDLLGLDEFEQRAATGQSITQSALETILREGPQPQDQPRHSCQFLRSGAMALAGVDSFRDIEEFTLPAVLESDVVDVLSSLKSKTSIDGYILPVAKRFRSPPEPGLPKYLGLADPRHYLPHLGFCDEPLSTGANSLCPPPSPPIIV